MGLLDRMEGEVTGSQGRLFNLTLVCTLLTLATGGVYSFWMRTRIRRWLWSSLRIGGAPFEYYGRPTEKLVGFLFAAVVVAIWLGLVTMTLIWASLNLFTSAAPGTLAAFALIVPIYYYAQYRGMRYMLGHTRWRGLSFWMEPGAWGYAWRAIAWGLLVIATLGLAIPARRRALWRYRTERARWGDAAFAFDARLGDLYRVFLPLAVMLAASIAIGVFGVSRAEGGDGRLLALLLITLPITLLFYVHWKVRSFAILASGIRLAAGPDLSVAPRVGRVIGIHILGWLAAGLAIAVALGVVAALGGVAAMGQDLQHFETDPPIGLIAVFVGASYLVFFVLRGAFSTVFVTYPLIRHVAGSLVVANPAALAQVGRGEGERMADADGFANLFDSGIGI